jgi:hypothetical protein
MYQLLKKVEKEKKLMAGILHKRKIIFIDIK